MKISPLTSFAAGISQTNILTTQTNVSSDNQISFDTASQSAGASAPPSGGGPPPEIQAQLSKYGLSATGSIEGDLAAIAAAKEAQESENASNEASQTNKTEDKANAAPPGPPPEILAKLSELGLQPTGSMQGDMAAIQNAMSQNQNSTQNPNFILWMDRIK